MRHVCRNSVVGFLTQSDIFQALQPLKHVFDAYNFVFLKLNASYYLCDTTNSVDCSCCSLSDDLHLCFPQNLLKRWLFHDGAPYLNHWSHAKLNTSLAGFCICSFVENGKNANVFGVQENFSYIKLKAKIGLFLFCVLAIKD